MSDVIDHEPGEPTGTGSGSDVGVGATGAVATAEAVGTDDSATGETVWQRQVRYFVGMCSLGAGVMHILAAGAHVDHHADLGRAFLMVAALQIAWGVMLMVAPTRLIVISGGIGTLAATVIWVISRTKGIAWWDAMAEVEPIEWRDTITMWLQILAIAGVVLLLIPAAAHAPAAGRPLEVVPIAVMALLVMFLVGTVYAATHSYVHDDHSHGTGTEMPGHTHDE